MALIDLTLGKIAQIVLNDAGTRNAMSEEMAKEFFAAVTKLKASQDTRVVIVTGAGEAFSGGGHLSMLEAKTKLSEEENRVKMLQFYHSFLSITELEVPVIAAVNGHAIGAGCCLALAADIRIAAKEAKLGFNFVSLGLHPGMGATYFLPRLVGDSLAAELLYSGSIISAESAHAIKLVNQVCSAGEVIGKAQEMAEKIASNGPRSIRELKKNLKVGMKEGLESVLKLEAKAQAGDYVGPEFLEGIRAAKEKRKPNF